MDELADPVHDLHLVRLEVADEVPAERVAVLGVLRLEILRAVLADHGDARLEQRRHVGAARRTSSPRRSSRPRRPARCTSREALADDVRRLHRSLPGRRAARPLRRCEKKSSGLQHVHRSTRSTEATPALRSARSAADHRSRWRVDGQVGVEARRHLVADLVAARADRRSDDRGASRRRPRRRPPRRCRCSARASRRARARVAARRRFARSRSAGSRRRTRASAVRARRSRARRRARRARPARLHGRRMHLPVERQVVVRKIDLGADAAAILLDALGVVARARGQVERLVDARR